MLLGQHPLCVMTVRKVFCPSHTLSLNFGRYIKYLTTDRASLSTEGIRTKKIMLGTITVYTNSRKLRCVGRIVKHVFPVVWVRGKFRQSLIEIYSPNEEAGVSVFERKINNS